MASTVRVLGLRSLPSLRCSSSSYSRLARPTPLLTAQTRLFSVGLQRVSQRPALVSASLLSRSYATQPPASETTEAAAAATTPEPEVQAIVESVSDPLSFTDAVVHQIPPLAYGDFAALGLASWSPIGLIAWSYELLQVSTGLPWFYTIIAGSALWRFVCVPFALSNIRNSTKLRPFQPQILQARERMTAAQTKRDAIELQRASVEMKKVYSEAGVSPFTGMILPMFAQLPITIGMFFALKRMAQLPVEQMKESGVAINLDLPWTGPISWLSDLTVADPTYLLPAAFCGLINLQIAVGAREMDTSNPSAGHLMNVFRGLSVLTIYFMSSFPQGLFLGLLTTSGLTIVQSLLLRSDGVRRLVGIPVVKREMQGKLPSFLESFRYARKMMEDKQKAAVAAAAQQHRHNVRRGPKPL
ncbi:inner membrane protein OXA1L [Coprinopsis cinerea okayama7|uniref:Inner membrane protein OXA1L n=1 Tax=Coprinopsis cinerea (strain Okayama-7 / 130 / ATCC MYA-4618 / FGSC 9003) TaxID=240176 RepID=A8NIM1_COPC7|nr:inner membrane protein OXA1L [Coprinopsis cinerea okayama7\|eukprot:XP_001834029.1 inner membrane protein OXA1L [Coprinopsis cinerea okayama7\